MRLLELKQELYEMFNMTGVDQSDADWLLVETLGVKRSALNFDRELNEKEVCLIRKLAKKRCTGVPLSQVLQNVDFFGLRLFVNNKVLTPRPETELLVEEILKCGQLETGLDIGTGSGAISIALSKLGGIGMTAVDISKAALKVAKKNAKDNNTKIKFLHSNLFDKINKLKVDFIVSNPPYIKSADIKLLDAEVKNHEPHIALDGGESGLDYYKAIIKDAPQYLNKQGWIFFELGIGQAEDVAKLLQIEFEDIQVIKDYKNINRIIKARLKENNKNDRKIKTNERKVYTNN